MADYGLLDRLLHRLALQSRPIAELSFDLDQRLSGGDRAAAAEGRHVFVSGLARAGTTILMRRLHATGDFRSLTYRDMPFVLAPGLWRRLTPSYAHAQTPRERAHGDRIKVSVDSPESLDEVFWRIFDADAYIAGTHLSPHRPDAETVEKFVAYVAAILAGTNGGATRYLSKNNNAILRLPSLRRAFPNAVILVPFRHPLSHARSLMRQHAHFTALQRQDPFVRNYMRWLGHHEFGLDHRPFRFNADGAARLARLDADTLDYWLELWCQTYGWLERTAPEDAVFVCYEDLCRDPAAWQALAAICETTGGEDEEPFVMGAEAVEPGADGALATAAEALYARLAARARSALSPGQRAAG